MPLECPRLISGPCDGCYMLLGGDKCNHFFPARPIIEILTTEERLARLESVFDELRLYLPKSSFAKLHRRLDDLQGQIQHIETKVNKHIDEPKKKAKEKKKKATKGAEV